MKSSRSSDVSLESAKAFLARALPSNMPRRTLLIFVAVEVVLLSTPASAQPRVFRQQVTLVGGAQIEGEVVELVAGDHLTLQLNAGEVRRIAWSEIASWDGAPPTPERTTWPEPDRAAPTPSEATRAQIQQMSREVQTAFSPPTLGRGLMLGAGIGLSGSGPATLDVGFEPIRWLSLELGGGFGAQLGPALREGLRANFLPWTGSSMVMRLTAGLAAQQNFLLSNTANDPTQSYPGAPRVAAWLIPFVGWDYLLWGGLGIRGEFGYGFLLNQGSYSTTCRFGSPCYTSTIPSNMLLGPSVLGVAAHEAGPWLFFRFEVIYRFDLGGASPPQPASVAAPVALAMRAIEEASLKLDAEGSFQSTGGVAGSWTMATDRCTSAWRRGFLAAELFSRFSQEDTEVVVLGGVLGGPELLVRVPGADSMVRVRRSDCAAFSGEIHQSGMKRGGQVGVEGTISVLDCALPGGGTLTGSSHFTCL